MRMGERKIVNVELKKPPLWILLLMLVTMLGCTAVTGERPLPLTAPTQTATSLLPTAAPTLLPTAENTPTRTARPSLTPRPSATPQTTLPPVVGVAGERTVGDPYTPMLGNTGYDVQKYTLRMTLDPEDPMVGAHVTVEAISTLANLGQISLDFIGFEIDELQASGAELAGYAREEGKLVINFAAPLAEGQPFSLEITYSGEPAFEPSDYAPFEPYLGLIYQQERRRLYVLSEPDGSRYYFPCNDHPTDKARFRFEITVPEELVAVANGTLVDTQTEIPNAMLDGRAGDRYIWEAADEMATYLAVIAIGDYVRVDGRSPDGVELRSYVFPDLRVEMEAFTPTMGEMLDWMSARFGAYPFEAYGILTVRGAGASMESQTMSVIAGSPSNEDLMAHEMAHMWFGDWVSLESWGDIWRNEGFATYIAALWVTRDSPGQMAQMMEYWEQPFRSGFLDRPLVNPPPREMFGISTYYKGALLVHDLREEMGDEAFFAGLRLYFERYGGGTAPHQQFQAALEEAAGKSLGAFFAEWLGEPVPQ